MGDHLSGVNKGDVRGSPFTVKGWRGLLVPPRRAVLSYVGMVTDRSRKHGARPPLGLWSNPEPWPEPLRHNCACGLTYALEAIAPIARRDQVAACCHVRINGGLGFAPNAVFVGVEPVRVRWKDLEIAVAYLATVEIGGWRGDADGRVGGVAVSPWRRRRYGGWLWARRRDRCGCRRDRRGHGGRASARWW